MKRITYYLMPVWMLVLIEQGFAQALTWRSDPAVAGYRLYVVGTTNLIATTRSNYFRMPLLPDGFYVVNLTAYDSQGNESFPAGPLFWTNQTVLTQSVESSADLVTWSNTTMELPDLPLSSGIQFYRGRLAIGRKITHP